MSTSNLQAACTEELVPAQDSQIGTKEKAAEMRKLVRRYVDIVTASRPWYADEGRYSKTSGADGDKVED